MTVHTNAKIISQSSAPNFKVESLRAMTRKTTEMVAMTIRIVIAAKISGARLSLSHGTALVQTLRDAERDSGEKQLSVIVLSAVVGGVMARQRDFSFCRNRSCNLVSV